MDVRRRLVRRDLTPRLDDGGREDAAAPDLIPLSAAHEVGDGERGAEVDGETAGVEVGLDRVERYRAAGEHRDVADRSANDADVIGAAEECGGIHLDDVGAAFRVANGLGR